MGVLEVVANAVVMLLPDFELGEEPQVPKAEILWQTVEVALDKTVGQVEVPVAFNQVARYPSKLPGSIASSCDCISPMSAVRVS